MNRNESTAEQNLRDADKAVLTGKFIALNAYIIKEQGPQINNVWFQNTVKKKSKVHGGGGGPLKRI